MAECATESAAQLVNRIHSKLRPPIVNISPEIIPNQGPYASEIIEINGDSNVGKSILLMELIGQAIIPLDYGGKGANVILIDLTSNFHLLNFLPILEKHILHYKLNAATATDTEDINNDSGKVNEVVQAALKNLHIYRCYSTSELEHTLMYVDNFLSRDQSVSLLAIESLGTFYWNDVSATNPVRMEKYLRSLLKNVKELVDKHGITIIYTRPAYLQTTLNEINSQGKASYQIELKIGDDGNFSASAVIGGKCFTRKYSISNMGIEWIYRGNTQHE